MTTSPENFDYVVVGGGIAGLVVATRLTEDPSISVCVLEAGPDVSHKPEIQVPGLAFGNYGASDLHWMYKSVPQPGANDRVIPQPRGKALGGSGAINYLTVGRGHAQEYEAFEALGSSGWNWQSILGGFKKSETFTVTSEETENFGTTFDPKYHGRSGPFQRTLPKWVTNLYTPFVMAVREQGIPLNVDPASGDNVGVQTSNHAIHPTEVVRSSTVTGYYEPAKNRTNLRVLTCVEATRVLMRASKGSHIAEGVGYLEDGQEKVVQARNEVILSAGSYGSPQLLELSGIGDKAILTRHGIDTVVDLPGVGTNLQEHIWCSYTAEVDPSSETLEVLADKARAAKELSDYQNYRTGMMTHIASPCFVFVPSSGYIGPSELKKIASAADGLPGDAGISMQKQWLMSNVVPQLELAIVPGFMPATGKQAESGKSYMSMLIALQHPFSRGSVHISSSDPRAEPLIDPRIFDNEVDILMMIEGFKFCRKIASSSAFKDIVKCEINPGLDLKSDEDLRKLAKDTVQTNFHPIGTAAMLPKEQKGVVDASLKVYGTENLRVIDASVMPIHISAHPQATVYAIAERAAELLKSGHESRNPTHVQTSWSE